MAFTKAFKHNGGWRTFAMVVGIVVTLYAVIGLLGSWNVVNLGGASGFFLTATGVADSGNNDDANTNDNTNDNVGGKALVIGTLKASAKEKYSNSYTAVGSGTQWLQIYDAGTDPSSPTASFIDRINVTSGSGSTTSKLVKTNTNYRVVFNGNGVWYDKDFGVMSFSDNDYNSETSELLFNVGEIAKIATLDDMLTESQGTDGNVNGATNSSGLGIELYGDASDSLVYNITAGDGQFYVKPTFAFSGAYTEAKNPVVCFLWDSSNPPEGNEITSITAQSVTGTDFGLPSELVNYWSTQQCVMLGSSATGGQSGQVKLTFTVNEANMVAADDWFLYFDDLSKIRGSDAIVSNIGGTLDSIKFDTYIL